MTQPTAYGNCCFGHDRTIELGQNVPGLGRIGGLGSMRSVDQYRRCQMRYRVISDESSVTLMMIWGQGVLKRKIQRWADAHGTREIRTWFKEARKFRCRNL